MSLFLGVAAGAAIAAPSPSSGVPDIVPAIPDPLSGKEEQVTKLPNGLSVLILKDTRFPLVSTRLYVHAGSSYETPDQAGISHVLEHMVFKGTDSRPKSAISQEVESAGGYLNAATSYDYTVYITDMPDRHWKLGMDVVRDMAFHPTLDPQELESEKNVIVAELQRGDDDPGSRMFKTLMANTLKGTPYDRPIIGYEKTIRALTTQNLRDYIAKYYQPQNMLLVVVGNVDPAEVLAEAEKMFAPYKNATPLSEVMPYEADRLPLPGSRPSLVIQPGPWNKVYLAAALPVPGSSSYQSATLDVLAYLLGGDRTSLFYKTYKYERQLVDSISVSNVGFERIGAFVVMAELDAGKVEPFWTSLTKDFAALDASAFTPEQLERAKLNLEDDLYRSKETLSGLASKIGYFQFFMGGDQGERNAIEALRNVDNNMLRQVLATWVRPDRLTTVVLPPKDAKMPDMQAILDKEWKSGAKASAAKAAEAGKTEVIDLGKGRTVVLIPDKTLPYVSANLTYSGGDALLKPSEQGLSALASNVLTKGTAKRSATEMQAFLADRAAGLAASSGRKTFSVNLTTPARFNEDLFELLGEVVTAPAFSEDETARGIKDQLAAIKSREDQPLGLAFRKLPPFLFPSAWGTGKRAEIRRRPAPQLLGPPKGPPVGARRIGRFRPRSGIGVRQGPARARSGESGRARPRMGHKAGTRHPHAGAQPGPPHADLQDRPQHQPGYARAGSARNVARRHGRPALPRPARQAGPRLHRDRLQPPDLGKRIHGLLHRDGTRQNGAGGRGVQADHQRSAPESPVGRGC